MVIVGHRGAMGLAPENTLASVRKALELDVDMIELDVYALATGEIVIIHDATVDRTTNGTGEVMQKTFAELRCLDAGDGEKIPTLQEACDLIAGVVSLNIELKGPETAEPVARFIRQLLKNPDWTSEKLLASSSDHSKLEEFHRLAPELAIALLYDEEPIDLELARELGADTISPGLHLVSEGVVASAHQAGKKVFVWTVNELPDLKRMLDWKVDGVFTNYPDRAKEVVRS